MSGLITIGQGFLDDGWDVTCESCGEVAHQVSRERADEAARHHASVECTEARTEDGQADVVEVVLSLAADRAEAAPSLRRAVQVAWGTLHSEGPDVMTAAFARWAVAEDVRPTPLGVQSLGGLLRRRYNTPDQIAQSLRAARDARTPA